MLEDDYGSWMIVKLETNDIESYIWLAPLVKCIKCMICHLLHAVINEPYFKYEIFDE